MSCSTLTFSLLFSPGTFAQDSPPWPFSHDSFQDFFQDDFFSKLEKRFFGNNSRIFKELREYLEREMGSPFFEREGMEWREGKGEKILVIKGLLSEKNPLKIAVKGDQVTLSGKVEVRHPNSRRVQQFHRTFPIPRGTDPTGVRVEKKEEEVHIIFPLLKKRQERRQKKNHPPQTAPLKPQNDDLTI